MNEFKSEFMKALNDGSEEVLTKEEIKQQEIKMQKYKNIFERPFYSENIYLEFNIMGLKYFYKKSQSELHDIRKLF